MAPDPQNEAADVHVVAYDTDPGGQDEDSHSNVDVGIGRTSQPKLHNAEESSICCCGFTFR